MSEKKGLFARLREGLAKTRDQLTGRVDTLVKETRKIDEDFYEELEDILLLSDCGMKATMAIMDELRERVELNKVKDALKGTDTEAIKADTEALEKAFYAVSEKLYRAQGAQGDAQGDPNGGAQGGDGTYYDTNFEDHSN